MKLTEPHTDAGRKPVESLSDFKERVKAIVGPQPREKGPCVRGPGDHGHRNISTTPEAE